MLELLLKLASTNSFSWNKEGLEKTSQILIHEIRKLKPDTLQTIPLKNGPALFAEKKGKKTLFFGGHMDTVFPENWPLQQKGPRLYGPGVCDMKGGLVILLHVLKNYQGPLGWRLIINPDEELGSPFSAKLIQTKAKGCLAALIFEPSLPNGNLVSSRKGSVNFRCSTKGKAAHVGRNPQEGVCAITKLARFIVGIEKLGGFVGKMHGGLAGNVIADSAECLLNFRFQKTFPEAKLKLLAHKCDVHLEQLNYRPPKPFEKKTKELFQALKRCGPISWESSGGVCDGNLTQAVGVPTIDTLGAEGGQIHTKGEFLIIKSLEKKSALTSALLKEIDDTHC